MTHSDIFKPFEEMISKSLEQIEFGIDQSSGNGELHVEACISIKSPVSAFVTVSLYSDGKTLRVQTGHDQWSEFSESIFYQTALIKALNIK